MAGPWEQYKSQSSKPWERYGAPPPSAPASEVGTISQSQPEDEGNALERFGTRLTGLPIDRIARDPNRYLNPFSQSYRENQDVMRVPSPNEMASGPIHIPGSDTVRDLGAHNWAAAAGDVLPTALAATPFAPEAAEMMPRFGRAAMAGAKAGIGTAIEHVPIAGPAAKAGIKAGIKSFRDSAPPAIDAPTTEAARPAQAIEESDIEEARRRPMARGDYQPEPAPYSIGPGQIPPDVVGQPNPNVLAGNQGIIVRKPLALPPARLARPMSSDAIDDMGVNQEMMQRANAEDRGDINADWNENKNAAVPKWKQVAQIRAQLAAEAVMKEAEAAQAIPARLTKTPKSSARAQLAKPQSELTTTPDDQLLPQLEESVRMARAKKQQK